MYYNIYPPGSKVSRGIEKTTVTPWLEMFVSAFE
jgi:hypothetical protein